MVGLGYIDIRSLFSKKRPFEWIHTHIHISIYIYILDYMHSIANLEFMLHNYDRQSLKYFKSTDVWGDLCKSILPIWSYINTFTAVTIWACFFFSAWWGKSTNFTQFIMLGIVGIAACVTTIWRQLHNKYNKTKTSAPKVVSVDMI